MSIVDDSSTSDDNSSSQDSPLSPAVQIKEEDFSTKTWCTDLVLIVEGKNLHVSKHVLALVSPVFEALFKGEFVEKYRDELPLPQKKYEDVLEFLRCIYPNTLKSVTLANVNAVLPLADEYQVERLKADCESCLMTYLTDEITTEELFELLTKAHDFHLKQLRERCIETAAERSYTEIEEADEEIKLPAEIKEEIRVRIIQKLENKYEHAAGHMVTSRAICKFINAEVKNKKMTSIVHQFMNGKINGDWESLDVRSTKKKSKKLIIDDITFSISASLNVAYRCDLKVFIESSCQDDYDVDCMCAVVVNNWMKNKDNIINVKEHQFTNETQTMEWDLTRPDDIRNENMGFIYKGNVNIDVFLFSIQKAI